MEDVGVKGFTCIEYKYIGMVYICFFLKIFVSSVITKQNHKSDKKNHHS